MNVTVRVIGCCGLNIPVSAGSGDGGDGGGEDETNMPNAERFTGAVDAEGGLRPGTANGDTDLADVDGVVASGIFCEEGRLPKEDLEEKMLLLLADVGVSIS